MRRDSTPSRWLALAVILALAPGCSHLFRSPTVELLDVGVVGLGSTSGTAEVLLRVENPNRYALELRELRYLVEVGLAGDRWETLAEGTYGERVRIEGRSAREVAVPVPFRYQGAGTALRAWWETGEIRYRIRGEVRARGPIRTFEAPFRSEGVVVP